MGPDWGEGVIPLPRAGTAPAGHGPADTSLERLGHGPRLRPFARERVLPTMPPWVHRAHDAHPERGVWHVCGVPRVAWWAVLSRGVQTCTQKMEKVSWAKGPGRLNCQKRENMAKH